MYLSFVSDIYIDSYFYIKSYYFFNHQTNREAGIVSLGVYYYFWQKTEKNPYFLSEKKALRFHPIPKNIHKTTGRYYSA